MAQPIRLLALVLLLSACRGAPETSLPTDALPDAHWQPEGQPRAHILSLHSFGDYSAAFNQLGPWFAERGYAVHAFDQRGFGRTPRHGHWAGTDLMVNDAVTRARRIAEDSDRPLYLLGESMGGAVAMLAAVNAPEAVDGLILAAPAVREGIWIRYIYNAGLSIVATVAPGATHEVERNPDNPDLDPRTAERLAHDPLVVRQVRMDTYRGLIALADRASNRAPEIPVPVLLMFGGRDDSIPEVSIEHLRKHLGRRLSWRFYPDGPHLLLQSRQWPDYAREISDWIKARSPGS